MSKNNEKLSNYSISQNFLTSRAVIERLLRKTTISRSDTVLEIGAGKGHITRALAQQSGRVISYEIDPALYARLQPQLPKNVTLYGSDFLKAPLPPTSYKVFANIPFSRTSEIIRKLTTGTALPEGIWLILEKGAAKRFCGLSCENLNSLLLRPFFETKIVAHLHREDFHPAPRVDTVLMEFQKKEVPDILPEQRKVYADFLAYHFRYGLWSSRSLLTRKQIATALKQEGLPKIKPSDTMLYVQWLCLFRCWVRYGKPLPRR